MPFPRKGLGEPPAAPGGAHAAPLRKPAASRRMQFVRRVVLVARFMLRAREIAQQQYRAASEIDGDSCLEALIGPNRSIGGARPVVVP
jgi:hypothetical protein